MFLISPLYIPIVQVYILRIIYEYSCKKACYHVCELCILPFAYIRGVGERETVISERETVISVFVDYLIRHFLRTPHTTRRRLETTISKLFLQ